MKKVWNYSFLKKPIIAKTLTEDEKVSLFKNRIEELTNIVNKTKMQLEIQKAKEEKMNLENLGPLANSSAFKVKSFALENLEHCLKTAEDNLKLNQQIFSGDIQFHGFGRIL